MAGTYYVHAGTVSRQGVFTADETWGPYSLKSAKDFARIGSQTGKYARAVSRGTRGLVVRVYRHGERVFPVLAADMTGLTAHERPKASSRPAKRTTRVSGSVKGRRGGLTRTGRANPSAAKQAAAVIATVRIGDRVRLGSGGKKPAVYTVMAWAGPARLSLHLKRQGSHIVSYRLEVRRGKAYMRRVSHPEEVLTFAEVVTPGAKPRAKKNPRARLAPMHEHYDLPAPVYAVQQGGTTYGTITKIGGNAYRASVIGGGHRDFVGVDDASEWIEAKAAQQRRGRLGARVNPKRSASAESATLPNRKYGRR